MNWIRPKQVDCCLIPRCTNSYAGKYCDGMAGDANPVEDVFT